MSTQTLLTGYFFGSILFLLIGCTDGKQPTQTIVNPNDCEWYVVPESSLNGGNKNQLDMYVLRLYANGSYIFCADLLFESGKWNYDVDKRVMVLNHKKEDGTEQIRYVVDEKQKNGKTVFNFFHQYPVVEAELDETVEVRAINNISENDPYALKIHSWRKKPINAETDQQIKERTINYLRFLEALYVHAIENNLENPGGTWYPQPIQFYTNKVRMAYSDKLTDWYECFFNEEQGIVGYKLISGALMKVKIVGDDDNSRNLNCVRQLINMVQNS
jgi:hypothetical protein